MPYAKRGPLTLSEYARRALGADALRMLRRVELECQTREEAEELADVIAGLLPDPVQGRLGLIELLLNAIEHGNLEIGRTLKCQLLRELRFEAEIEARMQQDQYRDRRVRVRVELMYPYIEIEIRDDGRGFAWRNALAAGFTSDDTPNGRGIALASRACFPTLEYLDPGNVAIVKLAWPR